MGVQFGSVWDGLSAFRGTRDVRSVIEPADWVVVDDSPIYNFAFSMDYLRGHARDKLWGNEIDGPWNPYLTDEKCAEQGIVSAERGAKFMLAANWSAADIRNRDKWTFWEKVMKEIEKPAPDIKPTQAVVLSLASIWRQKDGTGVDGMIGDYYAKMTNDSKLPIDILTDTVIVRYPEWLEQYTEGLYIPESQAWMTDELVNALEAAPVPVYAESALAGSMDEYGRSRSPLPDSWSVGSP